MKPGDWISVDKGLPVNSYVVLACNAAGVWIASYHANYLVKWVTDNEKTLDNITHWMPIVGPDVKHE